MEIVIVTYNLQVISVISAMQILLALKFTVYFYLLESEPFRI